MKNYKLLTLIVLMLSVSFSSCSKDEAENDFVEFGVIRISIDITQGRDELTKTLVASAAPSDSRIMYLNNGETFSDGPRETVQSDDKHVLTTSNDASNLNVGFNGIVLSAEEVNVAYTITVTFDGNQVEEKSFEFQSNGFTHTVMYSTNNGFSENLVNP